MIRRRHLGPAAAAAAAALLLAGCGAGGGGGGGTNAQGDVPAPSSAIPVASGASPSDSAALAIASLGNPGSVGPGGVGGTLSGYDSFGAPHDAFAQQVRDDGGSGSEATVGQAPPVTPSTTTGGPLVAVPGGTGAPPTTGPTTPSDPSAGAPIQSPRALEADFDVSGEPVVAREGDSIPPDTQQFEVQTISANEVVLKLSGGLLPDGTDKVTLAKGKSITLYNATARHSYRIKLVDIRAV